MKYPNHIATTVISSSRGTTVHMYHCKKLVDISRISSSSLKGVSFGEMKFLRILRSTDTYDSKQYQEHKELTYYGHFPQNLLQSTSKSSVDRVKK